MVEILGNDLKPLFDKTNLTGTCTYKGKRYEVWEMSDKAFEIMCDMTEEEFNRHCSDGWWRYSEGSNLFIPGTTVYINGKELLGWGYEPWGDEDDDYEIHKSNLSDYLCDVVGASKPINVCACAKDLAKYNNMTMAELFKMYEN